MKCPDCFSENYNIIDTDPLLMSCDDCHGTHSVSWSTGFWIGYLKKENEKLTVKCFICGEEIKVTIEEFIIADIGINPIACFKHADEKIDITAEEFHTRFPSRLWRGRDLPDGMALQNTVF